MVACSIKEMVEDVVASGELTRQDVEFISDYIGQDADTDTIVELLSIPQALDWNSIDKEYQSMLARYLKIVYAPNGVMTDISAKELSNLFDPEDEMSPHERGALKQLKNLKHGKEFQAFLDDNMI